MDGWWMVDRLNEQLETEQNCYREVGAGICNSFYAEFSPQTHSFGWDFFFLGKERSQLTSC
jgi:hypothetical protein